MKYYPHHPVSLGFYPDRFQNKKPAEKKRHIPTDTFHYVLKHNTNNSIYTVCY